GYVLVAMNEAPTVPLVNLRLIRGQSLYEGRFALLVLSNYNKDNSSVTGGMRQLLLSNLTEILSGGVKVTLNPLLCNMDTIQWSDIVDKSSHSSIHQEADISTRQCDRCDSRCVNGSCWAAGPDHCQKFTKLVCAEQCSARCHGPKPVDCCNQHCAAGCTGPSATQCLACRDFNDDGTCIDACPPPKIYDRLIQQEVMNPKVKYAYGATCVKACPCKRSLDLLVPSGSDGPAGAFRFRWPCWCLQVQMDLLVPSGSDGPAGAFRFRWTCWSLQVQMDLLEPSGCLTPICSSPLSQYSLVVVNVNHLRWLGLRSLKEISASNVMVKKNCSLCFIQTVNWTRLFRSKAQTNTTSRSTCRESCVMGPTCHHQCSEDGCWGPGPDMCVSCLHFNRRGRCVAQCNLLHGEPREVEVNSSCVECHSECLMMSEGPTCRGPGPGNCSQCAHFKDGHQCVARCPHGVLGDGDTLIWKYADETGHCQLCHQNCTEGTTTNSTLAVGVVGGLLVAVLVLLLIVVLLRRRRIKQKRTIRRLLQEKKLEPLIPSGQAPNQAHLRILKETELKKDRVLGSGAFGTVYKGLWFPEDENVRIPVAIKVLREATSPKANQEVLDEAYVMASVDHPHVCRLLGICLTSSVQLVTQLMPYGCLLDYVRHHQETICGQWLLNWCVQIAKGMSYLEERHLVHRDLAARNVLLKNPNHVKITDFGLAKLLTANETEYHADGGKVPIKWMALESILQFTFTHQSDVWSYGVTVWELMTFGSKPYDTIQARDVSSVLERGERLPQPPICTIDVYMIMVKCWMIDPASRPRFRELVAEFSQMARDPSRYLVIQGDLPSPSDRRFYSRLLSSDDLDDVVDAEEYLQPYKGQSNHGNHPCNTMVKTHARGDVHKEFSTSFHSKGSNYDCLTLSVSETRRSSSRLSEVFNPNYEDLNQSWATKSFSGPEYLNMTQSSLPPEDGDSLRSPDYKANFLSLTSSTSEALTGDGVFLPAAENLEYLGLGAALHAPLR
uniref:receptor protein-tyrosine kinase n=1 Tax=Nothobranchius furzeri TaxID=105023 RepID=A0A8C6LPM8_NOTFU